MTIPVSRGPVPAGPFAVGPLLGNSMPSGGGRPAPVMAGMPVAVIAPAGAYAPGGALGAPAGPGSEVVPMPAVVAVKLPTVNLLPPEIALRAKLRRVRGIAIALMAAVLLLTGVGAVVVHGQVNSARQKLDEQLAIDRQLKIEQSRYSQVPLLRQRLTLAEGTLRQAMGEEVLWSSYLTQLSRTVPQGVWLTQMNGVLGSANSSTSTAASAMAGDTSGGIGTVEFSGVATSYKAVADWIDVLNATKGYSNAFLTGSRYDKAKDLITFTSRVTLTVESHSNRF